MILRNVIFFVLISLVFGGCASTNNAKLDDFVDFDSKTVIVIGNASEARTGTLMLSNGWTVLNLDFLTKEQLENTRYYVIETGGNQTDDCIGLKSGPYYSSFSFKITDPKTGEIIFSNQYSGCESSIMESLNRIL